MRKSTSAWLPPRSVGTGWGSRLHEKEIAAEQRLDKLAKDQAAARQKGERVPLRPSREEYDKTIAIWIANGRRLPPPTADGDEPPALSVNEVILAYWRHAEDYYRGRDGRPDERELGHLKQRSLASWPLGLGAVTVVAGRSCQLFGRRRTMHGS
jgi:hypothetical protein